MILPAYVLELASYAQWQNESVFGLCAGLSDAERKRDRGMYFKSIHDTLDHMLLVDRLLLGTCGAGEPPPDRRPGRVYDEFDALREARAELDRGLCRHAALMTPEWLAEEQTIWSERLRRQRRLPRGLLLAQLFNHQTHHRSQVTTHLFMMGIEYGSTDLPANPRSQY